MAKVRLWKAEEDPKAANDALWTLRTALTEGLKLLHPYMPFITEEIYCTLLPEEESIMISEWLVYRVHPTGSHKPSVLQYQVHIFPCSL